MNYEDLTEEEKEIWDAGREEGYELGFDSGTEADNDSWDDAYEKGFGQGVSVGIKAERDRVQYVLQMMFDAALNMGHGNKAVQYKHAMDLLKPVNIDYSEEAYKRDAESYGGF